MCAQKHPQAKKLYAAIAAYDNAAVAETIAYAVELPLVATATQKAAWVEHITQALEKHFDEQQIEKIRTCCSCRVGLDECKTWIRELYVQSSSMEEFVQKMNEREADWFLKNGELYTTYASCSCAMLEGTETLPSKTWCHCTKGYGKEIFNYIFDQEVEVQVLETIKMGYPKCLIKIIKKDV